MTIDVYRLQLVQTRDVREPADASDPITLSAAEADGRLAFPGLVTIHRVAGLTDDDVAAVARLLATAPDLAATCRGIANRVERLLSADRPRSRETLAAELRDIGELAHVAAVRVEAD